MREHFRLRTGTAVGVAALCFALVGGVLSAQEPRFRGEGDHLTEAIELEDGLLLVFAGHRGSANFIVQVLDSDGDVQGIAVNAVGDYVGGKVIPVTAGTYYLQVTASGRWSMNADQPKSSVS